MTRRRVLAVLAGAVLTVVATLAVRRWLHEVAPPGKLEDYRPQGYASERGIGEAPVVAPKAPWFEEVRAEVGVDLVNGQGFFDNGVLGGGVAIDDVDGDGWPDLVLTSDHGAFLYRNHRDGTFELVADAIPNPAEHPGAVGATLADCDGDGHPDLFLACEGPNRLLRNVGGHFEDVTAATGFVEARPALSMGVSLADYDGDGDLDAFVANHVYSITVGNVATSRLFRNDGGRHFTDVTELLDVERITTSAYQSTWSDIDDDGDPDLFVVTDHTGPFGGPPNQLFRNDGPDGAGGWTFTAVSDTCACGARMGAMGVALGDYDRDGRADFYVSNSTRSGPAKGITTGLERLFRNLGGGRFADTTVAAHAVVAKLGGERPRTASWGAEFADLDDDGWLDLVMAFGQIVDKSIEPSENPLDQPNAVLHNVGGTFERIEPSGFENRDAAQGRNDGRARGIGVVDWDLDGCLDVVVMHLVGSPAFFHNRCDTGRHWVGLRLVGTRSNRDAVGAVARLTAGDVTQRQEVVAGSTSLMSSRWKVLHFGLDRAESAARIAIRWPSGAVDVLEDLAADRYFTLVEGDGAARPGLTPP